MIRTPWSVRFQRLLRGWPLQAVTFVVLAIVAAALSQRNLYQPNTIGQVAAVRVNITSAADGKLLPMFEMSEGQWRLFDKVYKGQVVARLDDSYLRTDLAELQQEAASLRAELATVKFRCETDQLQLARDHADAAADLAREVERCRLDILDRLSELEQDRLELQRLEIQAEIAVRGSASGMVTHTARKQLEAQRDTQAKLVASHSEGYRQAQVNYRAALSRIESHTELHATDIEQVLSPLREAISAAEARMEVIHAEMASLEIRSPINGRVSAVYSYPGQGVRSGEWIMTIAAESADHIIAYVRPDQQLRPVEGAAVGVRPRLPASSLTMTTAQRVASQWELLPEELRRDPNFPELCLPVQIAIPPGLEVQPGELVDITFFSSRPGGI